MVGVWWLFNGGDSIVLDGLDGGDWVGCLMEMWLLMARLGLYEHGFVC